MMRNPCTRLVARLACCAAVLPASAEEGWRELFNGRDLEGWTVVLENQKPGEDPESLAQVRDGAIHMYPDADAAATVPFGVIVHDDTFSRFHLTFEYKWNGRRFAPRKDQLRDAGLLYHSHNVDKVWPDSVEYQIQEGDTGDIVLLKTGAITWMRPDPATAPEGQGDPGMLPEEGGVTRDFRNTDFAYVGRLPELDHLEDWTRVDVVVHADETAEHLVNGETIARLVNLEDRQGNPLREGKIALQLEAAEILYRDVRIRELPEPLRADRTLASVSAVRDQPARPARIEVKNPRDEAAAVNAEIIGKDADAFELVAAPESIGAGESAAYEVRFTPTRGADRYSAGLRIGDAGSGAFVVLQGVGLAAFEGKNEPPLERIVQALGAPVDVGGSRLELDTRAETIGASLAGGRLRAADPAKKIRITPVARFSPPGVTPFGLATGSGSSGKLHEAGKLADSGEVADAHQALHPPLEGGDAAAEIDAPEGSFAVYMKAHQYTSFTDPEIETEATIRHTGRIYPIAVFAGRPIENAALVGFEEAANGDYQDAVFLVENVAWESTE